jgi:N-acyl-D-aspartate/D-glutamate deacylase
MKTHNLKDKLSRRRFLQSAAGLGFLAACGSKPAGAGNASPAGGAGFKLVIKNGKAFINGAWQTPFIGVTHDGRLKISATELPGAAVIDAQNRVVSTGFVDILADNTLNWQAIFPIFEKYKVADGVTTALQMHGGNEDVAAFYNFMRPKKHWVNYGVSTFVMMIRNRTRGLGAQLAAIERNLANGALGVSHSAEYQPATRYGEMVEYAKLAKKYERTFFLHLRYSSRERELEGVDEAVRIAKETGVRFHIDHLNSTGGTFQMAEALRRIKQANAAGCRITACVYPYSFWATYIASERFSGDWQGRYGLTYTDLTVVGTGERVTQQTFPAFRRRPGVLVAVPEGTMPFASTVDLALREDFCMIGSDGGIQRDARANNHPRGAGCFATAVRHGLSIGLPLEKVLEKITTLPRLLVLPAMQERGMLADGFLADLVIFDPNAIAGGATVANPNQFSKGIDGVIVNGEIAYQNGALAKQNGAAVRA